MAFQQYNVYEGLTAVRVVETSNLAGTYNNGQLNNGVGATLTVTATGALVIDGVTLGNGDSVILVGQSNSNENGIYIVSNPGATGIQPVLTRRGDFQNIEQIRAGQYVSIAAGTTNAGAMYAVIEPLPAIFGIDDLSFNGMITSGLGTAAVKAASDNSRASVASVSGSTTTNALAVFADTAGTVKNQTTTATLPFGLTLSTGNLTLSTGNVTQSAVNALTAYAGGGQGSATALTRQINRVTTVATGGDSVVLPAATPGKVITVINAAASNAMNCFPASGEAINALSADTALSIAANRTVIFFCAVAGTWNSVLTA